MKGTWCPQMDIAEAAKRVGEELNSIRSLGHVTLSSSNEELDLGVSRVEHNAEMDPIEIIINDERFQVDFMVDGRFNLRERPELRWATT
ncbi:hypothetical protein CHS0354_043043 [Potamilus streckersoni]|uniref:Uncharacterized protein n=1 Tax=Potamilus streckersoni TaxID=2493646 RepID=A0AAE0SCV5_9BIVA|nr:hypothetical protein CHS0354_043043 [Potamilus streckersoni]